MKFNVFQEPIVMTISSFEKSVVKNGAAAVVERIDNNTIKIYETMSYEPNYTDKDYLKEIQGQLDMENKCIIIVPPIAKSIITAGGNVMSLGYFFKQCDVQVEHDVSLLRRSFNIDADKVGIVCSIDEERDCCVYFGVTIENVTAKDLGITAKEWDKLLARGPITFNAREYMQKKRAYMRKHREEARGHHIPAGKNSEVIPHIKEWLSQVSFKEFSNAITARVKGQENVKVLIANVYHYLKSLAEGTPAKNNTLIAAPSGCGKTETFRALRDYFKEAIPELVIAQIDMTSITEEGYRGKDVKDMLRPLLEHADTNGIGIMFCDEFDKKLMPSYTSQGNNVNAAIQAQILTVIEGTVFSIDGLTIDTSNTLFVGLGSFDTCRKKRENVERHLGFGAVNEEQEHYDDITRQDMIELGASYELLGRFPLVMNYRKLDDEIICEIIDDEIKSQEKNYNCKIEISDYAKQELVKDANSEYGCRLIKNKIQEAIMPPYMELLYSENMNSEQVIYINEI